MPLTINSPAVQAAADELHRRNPVWNRNMALKDAFYTVQAAGVQELVDALEEAKTGLLWYQDRNPGQTDGSDDEAMARIDATLAKFTGG